MCTSFMFRGNDILIGMNYDNHGKNFKVMDDREDLFLVTLPMTGQDIPLFGIRNDGIMVNQQIVNECEAGKFRIGPDIIYTFELLEEVLLKRVSLKEIEQYMEKYTVLSVPDRSLHVMIASAKEDSYIIEPGRGMVKYPADKRYIVMSNCPVCDAEKTGKWEGDGVDRQLKAQEVLQKAPDSFGIKDAFELLKLVHQTDELWTTEFSFVYSFNENKVYYCYDHQFDDIKECQLKSEV